MVRVEGSFPASVNSSRMLNNGMASATRISTAAVPVNQARRWMKRLQRCQNPFSGGGPPLRSRPGTCSLSIAFPANPSMAGRSVSAAMSTMNTAAMHAVARPIM